MAEPQTRGWRRTHRSRHHVTVSPATLTQANMSNSPASFIFLSFFSAVPLIIGLVLFRRGWRGRRSGDSPHCAACDYSLVGNHSGACPECGAALTAAGGIVRGNRARRKGMLYAGAAL